MLIDKLPAQLRCVLTAAAPSVVVRRSDDNPMHSNAPASKSARNIRIDLPLPLKCPPRVEKSAILLICKRYKLKFALVWQRWNFQPRYERICSVSGIFGAHVRELASGGSTNPDHIPKIFRRPNLRHDGVDHLGDLSWQMGH
jgi:hypothetical protein